MEKITPELHEIISELKGMEYEIYVPILSRETDIATWVYATKDGVNFAYIQWSDSDNNYSVSMPIEPSREYGSSIAIKYSSFHDSWNDSLTVIEAVEMAAQPESWNWLGVFANNGLDQSIIKYRKLDE